LAGDGSGSVGAGDITQPVCPRGGSSTGSIVEISVTVHELEVSTGGLDPEDDMSRGGPDPERVSVSPVWDDPVLVSVGMSGRGGVSPEIVVVPVEVGGDSSGVPVVFLAHTTWSAIQSNDTALHGSCISIVNPVVLLSVIRKVVKSSAVAVIFGVTAYGREKSTRTVLAHAGIVAVPAISRSWKVTRQPIVTSDWKTTLLANVTASENVVRTETVSSPADDLIESRTAWYSGESEKREPVWAST